MKNKIILLIFIALAIIVAFLLYKKNDTEKKNFTYHNEDIYLRVDRIRDLKIKKQHIEMPESVKAIYMSSWVASTPSLRKKLIDFIDESEINSIVVDVKDYSGLISFDIENELIDLYATDSQRIHDIDDFIKDLHDRNIYIIARVTVFQDPLLAKQKPEFAFKRIDNGQVWKDRKGLAFIDPQKKEAWEYFAVLAEETYKKGFDEINFDYIRFPSDGDISNIDYQLNGMSKMDVMKDFYVFLDERLRSQDIPISADLFGHTASQGEVPGIGQNLADALPYFDAIAPMVYPSHYHNHYLGFANPADHPYEVVYNEMKLARKKSKSLGLPDVSLRTWIQDFDLGADYDADKVRDQIKASYDAGVSSYMVWDPKNKYTKSAYYKDVEKTLIEKDL